MPPDYAIAEIARETGCKTGTVKMFYAGRLISKRAEEKIRKLLTKWQAQGYTPS